MRNSMRKVRYPAIKCPRLKKSIAAIDISSLVLAIKVILTHQLNISIILLIKIKVIIHFRENLRYKTLSIF